MSLQEVVTQKPSKPFQPKPLPQVRSAVPEDFPQLMALCGQLYQENGAVNVDWGRVEAKVAQGVNGMQAVIGVIGEVRAIQAMIYLQITDLWYSGEIILEELFSYVSPEYRRTRNARAILEFAKSAAVNFNVPLLVGVTSNTRTQAKIEMYERILGPTKGALFFYNVKKWKELEQPDVRRRKQNDK